MFGAWLGKSAEEAEEGGLTILRFSSASCALATRNFINHEANSIPFSGCRDAETFCWHRGGFIYVIPCNCGSYKKSFVRM